MRYTLFMYRVEPFGELVIPVDLYFATPLADRLTRAGNEEAMQDLLNLITRIRRTRGTRFHALLGDPITTNLAGVERSLRGLRRD